MKVPRPPLGLPAAGGREASLHWQLKLFRQDGVENGGERSQVSVTQSMSFSDNGSPLSRRLSRPCRFQNAICSSLITFLAVKIVLYWVKCGFHWLKRVHDVVTRA